MHTVQQLQLAFGASWTCESSMESLMTYRDSIDERKMLSYALYFPDISEAVTEAFSQHHLLVYSEECITHGELNTAQTYICFYCYRIMAHL